MLSSEMPTAWRDSSARRGPRVAQSSEHRHDPRFRGQRTAGRRFVLEFVEGDTLADRIANGPLPLAEALPSPGRSRTRSTLRTKMASSTAI